MRVLAITKLFPNCADPLASPFNRQQFAHLGRFCELEVWGTIPWFPGASLFGRWSKAARLRKVPSRERISGMNVRHPRFLYVPKLLPGATGYLYAASMLPALAGSRRVADVLLGCWAYPDGFASVSLARWLGIPCVVKLHGSDIDVVAKMKGPQKRLRRALPRASRIVAVSRSLAREAHALGVREDRIDVVYNGIDRDLFRLRDRASARRELHLDPDAPLVLFVGRVEREKGVLELIEAMRHVRASIPTAKLALVGDGSERAALATSPGDCTAPGARPLQEVPVWMAAADVVCLPSWHEGTPNVILEALACGRRVVASDVGGIPDLITNEQLGRLVPARNAARLATALVSVLSESYSAANVNRLGAGVSWEESAAQLFASLERAATSPGPENLP